MTTLLIDTGNTALKEGRWQVAADAFRAALEGDQQADALLGLGQALWWLGDMRLRTGNLARLSMKITVELPEDVMQRPDPGREALQALALAGYRSGVLTHYQASRLLEMSRLECDALLKSHQVEDHAYDVGDLEQDLATLERLAARAYSRPAQRCSPVQNLLTSACALTGVCLSWHYSCETLNDRAAAHERARRDRSSRTVVRRGGEDQ